MMLEACAGDSLLPSQDRTTLVHSDVWRDLQATLLGFGRRASLMFPHNCQDREKFPTISAQMPCVLSRMHWATMTNNAEYTLAGMRKSGIRVAGQEIVSYL
jgi:hypothetical protein